eukprot:TRINITY_DN55384_c0_g1_i1.p1 TRINITY_DN55384_c0_g1~~TRINITY_DN55384_c0_g1_i1.p1  ORF type:complete len:498 (-),score=87.74 TRINITY_DN55384_c0_g1_i1:44-1516(-)
MQRLAVLGIALGLGMGVGVEGAAVCKLKANVPDKNIVDAISWACNGNLNCSDINPGGAHYLPNTPQAHGEWLVGTYYQLHSDNVASCDFGGIAMLDCDYSDPSQHIRAVNLGGWLVLEPWIVPSLFQQFVGKPLNQTAIDEHSFCSVLGQEEAQRQLDDFRSKWVTEDDIQQIKAAGLNTVRVPFGHWVFGDVPPYVGAIEHLDRIVNITQNYGIKVLLDLHGVPGSQNGFDNSGLTCASSQVSKKCLIDCPADPTWATTPEYLDQSLKVIDRVVQRYQKSPSIWGIEVVNEPRWDTNLTVLKDFYVRAYNTVRTYTQDWYVVLHDSFRYDAWSGFMPKSQGYSKVMLDRHIYESFNADDLNRTETGHLQVACAKYNVVKYMQCNELPTFVGEWSLATFDCDQWIRGFGQPPMFPSYCPRPPVNQTFVQQYATRQLSAWERSGNGWSFWAWKTEAAPLWSYKQAVASGYVPSDVSQLDQDPNMDVCLSWS